MKCSDLQELVSAYANGELPLTQQEFVDEHLAGCANCRSALADYTWVRHRLTSLRESPVTSNIKEATMLRIESIGTAKKPIPRLVWPAFAAASLVAVTVAVLVVFLSGGGLGGPIAQAYAATAELQSYRMSGTSVALVGASEVNFDWEFVAPDSYHGVMTIDGLLEEFILVGDEQYIHDVSGAQRSGSVVIVADSIYNPIPSREDTLRFLDSLTDAEQLPNEQIEGVNTAHYLGRVDLDRTLDEQLASLDPDSPDYHETLAFVELQRTAQIGAELWIGEEAHRIQQMSLAVRFPNISSGPDGAEQQGSSGFSTVVRYSDFNSGIEVKPPVAASGDLIAGWHLPDSGPPESTIEDQRIGP